MLAATMLLVCTLASGAQADDPPVESWPNEVESIARASDENMLEGVAVMPPDPHPAFSLQIPHRAPGLQFSGGVLMLQPSADNLGWAVLTVEKNYASPVPLASPYWEVQSLRPGYQPGFEFGASYSFARPGTDFQVNWQHLRTKTSDAVGVWDTGQWISPFSQTGPPTADSYDQINSHTGVNKLLSAEGLVKFAYDAVNFDFGQYITIGAPLTVRLFGGLSYARIQEKLVSSFYGTPPPAGTPFPGSVPIYLSLNNTSTFSGVGPRLGIDTNYQTQRGLRFTGQLAGNLLIGPTQPAQYEFTATSPELAAVGIPVNYEFISSKQVFHAIWAANARLGAGFSRRLSNGALLTVDGGYMAAVYANALGGYETNNNVLALQIGSLSTASMRQTLSNFSVNGFYLDAGLKF